MELPKISDSRLAEDITNQIQVIGYQGNKRTILLVDDLSDNRLFLINLLQSIGFNLLEASKGVDAIALACQHQPDLILLDLVMPEMNGWEVTKQIRQDETLKDIPIIIVSATTFATKEFSVQEVGANAFLAKPLDFEALLDLLAQFLELEWIYQQNPQRDLDLEASLNTEPVIIPPTQEELNILLNLVLQGDIRAILSQATLLETNSDLVAFATKLRQLAETCQIKKLKQFLQQYLSVNS